MERAFDGWLEGKSLRTLSLFMIVSNSACTFAALSSLTSVWTVPHMRVALGQMVDHFALGAVSAGFGLLLLEAFKHVPKGTRWVRVSIAVLPAVLAIYALLQFVAGIVQFSKVDECLALDVPPYCLPQ